MVDERHGASALAVQRIVLPGVPDLGAGFPGDPQPTLQRALRVMWLDRCMTVLPNVQHENPRCLDVLVVDGALLRPVFVERSSLSGNRRCAAPVADNLAQWRVHSDAKSTKGVHSNCRSSCDGSVCC